MYNYTCTLYPMESDGPASFKNVLTLVWIDQQFNLYHFDIINSI